MTKSYSKATDATSDLDHRATWCLDCETSVRGIPQNRLLGWRGELNQLELSKRVGIASTTAVPALDNMEKRGLAEENSRPKDRRKYYISPTNKGRRIIDELMSSLLAAGEIDGVIGPRAPSYFDRGHPQVKYLFEDPHKSAADCTRERNCSQSCGTPHLERQR
jgi:DNA-binding PadR family transcriptional regulator